jgi:hypothetical protein
MSRRSSEKKRDVSVPVPSLQAAAESGTSAKVTSTGSLTSSSVRAGMDICVLLCAVRWIGSGKTRKAAGMSRRP